MPTSDGCCPEGPCGPQLDRRAFLRAAAVAAVAGPFTRQDTVDHFVPADKKLSAEWLRALAARGQPETFSGDELRTIGMPVGGICAGQVYLSGAGRLIGWDVFNENANTGYGRANYVDGRPAGTTVRNQELVPWPEVDQGFALRVRDGDRERSRSLDRRGFPGVRFRGAWPLAFVDYPATGGFPVSARLQAFSPFAPLDAKRSAFPATVLEYVLTNESDRELDVDLAGWLQNAVASRDSARRFGDLIERHNRVLRQDGLTAMSCHARLTEPPAAARAPLVYADFEGENYGAWRIEGEAFGTAPARGTLESQQEVSGYEGEGLVNTFLGGDRPQGRLLSPEFVIERPWIAFLIGGGGHEGATCVNLLVDGEVARTATGRNRELLEAHNWDVRALAGRRARIEIVDAASGAWGHVNVDRIEFRDDPVGVDAASFANAPDRGTMALACALRGRGVETFARAAVATGDGFLERLFDAPAGEAEEKVGPGAVGAVGARVTLAPGGSAAVTFVVAWHFPNLYRDERLVGNRYAKWYVDAADVARRVVADLPELESATRLWSDTFYDSTLPYWLLDRLHSTVANLATPTAQWWRDGRFWAWEGAGCCRGTCGHVWNYAQGLARLFPELERSVRERQDFEQGVGMHEDGSIGFRGEGWSLWAGDAQAGYVLKAYREHLCSADDAFLERNWREVRMALEFLIGQDGNADGLIEGRQHQTYDKDYFGANTFVGALYLAALRAGEEMARRVGDDAFAARCRAIFESGSRRSAERLYDEKLGYFVQDVDLEEHPDWQYGKGCLADQLFGQGWAHQVGLGYVYPPSQVRTALGSIWKYDWAPDVARHNRAHEPERWFARPGEAGLFTCTWPKSEHPGPRSTRYRNEVWTGIEYQVAGHMVWEGMVTEALAICRAVHERYHPARRNPYNEIECGDHYARSLASWGVLIALCGFEYDGPSGHLGLAPRITPEAFRCAFTAAEGWGSLDQRRREGAQIQRIEVKRGRLRLRSLAFELREGADLRRASATAIGGGEERAVPLAFEQEDGRVRIGLEEELLLTAGESLTVRLAWT